jgi:hypothetical protein
MPTIPSLTTYKKRKETMSMHKLDTMEVSYLLYCLETNKKPSKVYLDYNKASLNDEMINLSRYADDIYFSFVEFMHISLDYHQVVLRSYENVVKVSFLTDDAFEITQYKQDTTDTRILNKKDLFDFFDGIVGINDGIVGINDGNI